MARVHNEDAGARALIAALTWLPDNASRMRALRRAAEHFAIDPRDIAQAPCAPTDARTEPPDEAENLQSLFEAPSHAAAPSHVAAPSRASAAPELAGPDTAGPSAPDRADSVETDLHSFIEDFQKLARDWHSA
jgi:hypothetical protein